MTNNIKFYSGENIPLELHKVRVVQKLHLVPIERRLQALEEGGFNTFKLNTTDVFLDMLTDSGTNAMSDNQVAAMFHADDAYAGSQSFVRLLKAVQEVLGKEFLLPVHQGRAAENIICRTFIKPGQIIPMNYHFTTALAHITENGGKIAELLCDDALDIQSVNPFKGNIDIQKLKKCIQKHGAENIPFIRMEASTNLIGGQPFSIHNLQQVREVADQHGIMLVLDASLLGENAFLVKQREEEWKNTSLAEILKVMTGLADLVYFSARKLSSSRGGGICTNNRVLYSKMEALIPLFEGFLTYGGISVREIEAMAVGLRETQDETIIRQSPDFIAFLVNDLQQKGIPVVTPAGVLGCHVDAMSFCKHIPQTEYPAGALAAAFYLISGVRGMERGTISSVRDEQGKEILADLELLRLALPRRVFTLSQIKYVSDRMQWLFDNRHLIGGLQFVYEPPVLRFFMGSLIPTSDWPLRLVTKFKEDFGESL
ncbi:tryptophanase [Butyricimonas paravirosa]|uniref:tryptophanase n=1 Tax=Butyricimonas paravirosa TaxID=1472417 RepID=UPI00210863DB|nr:tryptophanase [Butyricimonas paravirosa]MCQ4873844.1 tryptophanase [Butyricimonas paravirosa]